jgi:hypothetical protein
MSITLALVIAVWYLVLATGFFAIGWQCAALIFVASTIACVAYMLLDVESKEDEVYEEDK